MTPFIVYDNTGRIIRSGNCAEVDFEHQAGDAEKIMEGSANPSSQFIEKGQVVDMPDRPDDNHVFDYVSKTWLPDLALAATRAITKRSKLLADGPDRVNPMWWASMSTTEQSDVTAYRQALLDVPQQPGYPLQIDWPPLPAVFSQ